jgi:hypothetical protein
MPRVKRAPFGDGGVEQGSPRECRRRGSSVDVEGIDIIRFADDGLALEHWESSTH